jgi:hypothetical protein
MNCCTAGIPRKPFAAAIATRSTTNPMGSNHSTSNHRLRPIRSRGAIPCTTGTEPDQEAGSTTSSPRVNCARKLSVPVGPDSAGCTDSGVAREASTTRWAIAVEGPSGEPVPRSSCGRSDPRSARTSSTPLAVWMSWPCAGTTEPREVVVESLMICRQAVEGPEFSMGMPERPPGS